MNFIGIDIGRSGFIVNIKENSIDKHRIPLNKDKKIDEYELKNVLLYIKKQGECLFVFEALRSVYMSAAKANFSFGDTNGLIRGILIGLDCKFKSVHSKIWQKEMFKNTPIITNKVLEKGRGVIDTKKMSIITSKMLFPNFDLRISNRASKDNHNVSDALLIAEYARRTFKNVKNE